MNLRMDTINSSLVHAVGQRLGITNESLFLTYLRTVGLVALVLFAPCAFFQYDNINYAAAKLANISLFSDFSTLFIIFVSLPLLISYLLTDDAQLNRALSSVENEGVLIVDAEQFQAFQTEWALKFRRVNISAHLFGAVTASVVTAANFRTYVNPEIGFWISEGSTLLPEGWFFMMIVWTFYFVLTIYVFRSIASIVALHKLVSFSRIDIIPFHPDHCGGLGSMGKIGLRNQYLLSLFGINLVLLFYVSKNFLTMPPELYALIGAACVTYVILSPVVFVGPLLPFRDGMLKTKSEIMAEVANRLKAELVVTRDLLRENGMIGEQEKTIGKLKKIGKMVEELPVWPFDVFTIRKFITAYLVPVVSALGAGPLINFVSSFVN
jgi:hypothetical protein